MATLVESGYFSAISHTSLMVGGYEANVDGKVYFTKDAFYFKARHLTDNKIILDIVIPKTEVNSLVTSFENGFIKINPTRDARLRIQKDLNIIFKSMDVYFGEKCVDYFSSCSKCGAIRITSNEIPDKLVNMLLDQYKFDIKTKTKYIYELLTKSNYHEQRSIQSSEASKNQHLLQVEFETFLENGVSEINFYDVKFFED